MFDGSLFTSDVLDNFNKPFVLAALLSFFHLMNFGLSCSGALAPG
jgi:hypothetical protein